MTHHVLGMVLDAGNPGATRPLPSESCPSQVIDGSNKSDKRSNRNRGRMQTRLGCSMHFLGEKKGPVTSVT